MAKINTLNYQTVASWNGSQDLFVVEQSDGTKVATPAMVKQYVLAGVTETSEQYAECSTARNVAAKTVTLPGFILEAGARISVRFTDTGASNPASGHITLNVNGTGAKEIVDGHTNMTILGNASGGLFYNNLVNDFVYDGTYWVYMNRDNNTTYTSKAAASGGTATSLCTTGEKYTWNNKQAALTFDNVPTQNSNNPVKSGGIYSKIGDLTQTGLTGDSVAAQLSGSLSPIDAIVKRFYINNGNTSLDTGINVKQDYTTGFAAIVSTFGTYNAGVASVYIGGVAHKKQDGTVGDINFARLGGVGIGGSQDGANMQFSVVNDKLQLKTYQYQVGACVTLILSKRY